MSIQKKVDQSPRSRSQGKKWWYQRKGLVTRNAHVKYQSSSTHCSKVKKQGWSFQKMSKAPRSRSQGQKLWYPRRGHKQYSFEISKFKHSVFKSYYSTHNVNLNISILSYRTCIIFCEGLSYLIVRLFCQAPP